MFCIEECFGVVHSAFRLYTCILASGSLQPGAQVETDSERMKGHEVSATIEV